MKKPVIGWRVRRVDGDSVLDRNNDGSWDWWHPVSSDGFLFKTRKAASKAAPSDGVLIRVVRKPRRITREEFVAADKALDLQMLREHTHEYATTAGLRAALATLGIEVEE